MKKNNLPLLISVTIVIFLIILVGISSSLTLSSTRQDAFRIEANKVLEASRNATEKLEKSEIELIKNKSCKVSEDRYCYTIDYLIDNNIYNGDSEKYIGKVIYDKDSKSYELYIKKNDEFRIIAGSSYDYTKSGILSREEWKEEYSICECNE